MLRDKLLSHVQEKNSNIKCFLVDPPGSGLFNKVIRGVMYTREEAEGRRLKNPFDTITEGIGINRLTENFKLGKLDGAFQGTDMEAVEMSRLVHMLSSLSFELFLSTSQDDIKNPFYMLLNVFTLKFSNTFATTSVAN